MKDGPEYFGFTEDNMLDSYITLKFRMLEFISNGEERRKVEKEFIEEKKPISQSGIRDRMKSLNDKKEAINKFLVKAKL